MAINPEGQKSEADIISDHVSDTFDFAATDTTPDPVDNDADTPDVEASEVTVSDASERNEERQRTEAMQAQLSAQEQRFNAYMAAQQQPQEQAPQIPEYDDDPAGNIVGRQAQIEAQLAQQNHAQQTQVAEQQQLRQTQHVVSTFNGMEQTYAQENPDYYPRIDALKTQRAEMWVNSGMTREQANHMVTNEAMGVIQTALSHGRNPAEALYSMTQPVAQPGLGASRQTPSSLGSRSGGSTGPKNVRDLMKMSDADFDRATAGDNWEDLHQRDGLV